jgi:DNA-directed RNA polymerase specialized sigma24 family protein
MRFRVLKTLEDAPLLRTLLIVADDDSTETPAIEVSMLDLLLKLPSGWRNELLKVILLSQHTRDYSDRSRLSEGLSYWTRGSWDDVTESCSTSGLSTSYLLNTSFYDSTENYVVPSQVGVRIAEDALPAVIESLTGLVNDLDERNHLRRSAPRVSWWESQLPTIKKQLNLYVRKRLPARPDDQEDLVSETFLSFCQQIRQRPEAFPHSWFEPVEPASDSERGYLQQLLTVILRRRIADHFRAETRAWSISRQNSEKMVGSHLDSETQTLFATMLTIVLQTLADSTESDRDILALVSGTGGVFEKALHPRDRQRLKRLRAKLGQEIRKQLGSKASDLLTK